MKRILTHLFVAVLLMVGTTSWAQTTLEVGKIYHFQNAHFTGRAITAVDGNNASVQAAATNNNDLKQQWYVTKDGEKYIFRNMYNGYYLSQTLQSTWGLTETCTANSNKFEYIVAGGTNNTIRSASVTNTNGYMHLGSATQTNIQGWGSGSGGTQWTVTNVAFTEAHDAILGQFAESASTEVVSAALNAIFSDGACSVLKEAYTSANMTNEQLYADVNYQALPTALRKMVKKVRGNDWSEATVAPADRPNGNNNTNHSLWTVADTWDGDYAKKFRVQMYEPYSIESEVTSYLRINAHCNMDNPTGIYANSGDVIYIMVDGDIPEGAELWLAHQSGNGATQYYNNSAYTQLHKGLNRVTFTTDGCQMWINYVVHTYNADGATIAEKFPESRKLSNYKPLKIHIEGGHINGFFNALGDFRATTAEENLWGDVDNDADWNYYKARVALPTDFALLGHRQTLLFPFGAYDSEKGYFGVANADGGIEKALAYHLETVAKNSVPYTEDGVVKYKDAVLQTPNCYSGSDNSFGNFSDTYYPGMGLSTDNGKINIMMEAWDRITYSELASMGLVSTSTMDKMNALYPRWTSDNKPAEIYNYGSATVDGKNYLEFCQGVDYSEYFNHHACGVGAGSGYMSGGWRVCNYHYNTMGSIIGAIAAEAGPTWGPAHEIGHQHQAVFNLNGQTEVTNNFFSNVAVWYMGMGTSRVNGSEGSLESVLAAFNTEGNDLYTNNIWAITHLYYRLWLYYHLAGNNTQFWPRLFELCRQEPLINGGQISGETSLLRFYQHACDAAGEDLTEFFRAHGFFEIMDNRLVGDYSNATYNVTQEQIDAAIAEIKEKNYPVNYAVLLINDGTSKTTKMHNGSTARSLWDGSATAEFGSVNDFISGDVVVETNYSAVVNADGSITMSGGQGGVGFLVFNEKGELIAFSNKATFKLSDEALETIVSGKATVVTVDAESNVTTAEVDVTAMQRTVLEQLIAKAQPIIDKIDDTYTKIGYFKGAAVADLASALAYAKEVYEGSSGFEAAYDLLYAEYTKVLANTDSKIPFNPSLTYIITNYGNPAQTMWVNSENTVRSEGGVDQTSNDARWEFVETSTAGVYNIRTLNNDYIPAVQQSASMTATTGQADNDALYTLEEVKDGVWAIKLSPAEGYRNLHSSWNNVVGWETGADASRWYLTAVEADPVIADLTDLEVYINKTELLLEEVLGTVTYTKGEALPLQTGTQGSAYYLWSNAPETREGNIANLVDGGVNNHFHTDYSSEPPSGSHYLAVYLGEENTLERFTFSHTTRSGASSDFPKSVDVYGSNDGTTYKFIGSASGMPQSAGTAWEFDGVMLSSYKYLRFNYHAPRGYWHMAEFDITPVTGFTATVNDTYSSTVTVDAVTAAMNALFNGKRTATSFSPTTDDVAAKLSALQTTYNALYAQYEATVNARKATLAQLATETETLINQVGVVELAKEEKLTLTTENLYCNAPYMGNNSDNSTQYVNKLTDGSKTTFLHTDYSGTVAAPHYLRVDLGSGSATTKFRFSYSTRDNGNNCPTTIVVEGCNEADGTYTTITTLTTADGLPNPGQNTNGGVAANFESSVIEMSEAYRYVRFKVTSTEGSSSPTFFVISEFGMSIVTQDKVTVNNDYKEGVSSELLLTTVLVTNSSKSMSTNALVTSVPLLDAQIADQTAAKAALEEAMAKKTVDKTALQELYNLAAALYGKMTDGDGNVNDNYRPSALTNEKLAEAKTALDAAKDKLDNSNSQTEIDEAEDALQTAYDALLVIENANVATTIDKSGLNTAITNANELIAIINANSGYYEAVAGLGLTELGIALQNAQTVVERNYFTQAQYDDVLNTLNACVSATQTVVNADCTDRTALQAAIADANTLLTAIAEENEKTVALPLQSTNVDAAFYIWCNAPAGDSNGVAGLIDKNDDGTANIGTFLGTDWANDVDAYTHYIEIDLGVDGVIANLLMDYTTRNSTHADQRPNAIKILGSNDKENYTPITEITEGLATGQTEKWEMATPLELGAHYRYIRIAVGSQRGFFHMADFNLYTVVSSLELKDYYTTAEGLDLATLCLALDEAQDATTRYMTEEQYNTAYGNLSTIYTNANDIVEADYTGRDALSALMTEVDALVDGVVVIDETEAVLALQATDVNAPYYIYCNAPGATNNYSGDNLGVAALLDVDDNGEPITATFLHTTYTGDSHDDALDHYLRVDMGESNLLSFKFRYTPRIGNTGNAPLVMLIEGSNDCVNFEEITTLTGMATTYQSDEITNGKAYRYIRFMVKDTHNHGAYNEHPFFAMSHFEMTACKTITISQEYASTNLSVDVAANAYNSLADAANIILHYATNAAGTDAKNELQSVYDALDAARMAIYKEPLKELIDATTLLKNSLYEIAATSYTATEITLSATEGDAGYLYCNAVESHSSWATDHYGVSALLDEDTTNHLHTMYSNYDSEDGLDHYLRVDLGDGGATEYLEFGYKRRVDNNSLLPKSVVVEACNSLENDVEWTTIATLTNLPDGDDEKKTGVLGNGVAYRYWRFMVTETHGNSKSMNHPYFALRDFNVYKCTDIEFETQLKSEYDPDIYIYTTTELVAEVEDVISAATVVYDNAAATAEDCNGAITALQAEYDKLAEAINYHDAPVRITTDEENPVLYKIISKRDDNGGKVLQFDEPASNNVTIVDAVANASYQAWYFMKGENGYLIKPFNSQGNVLGVEDTSDGEEKALIAAEPASAEWAFARSAVEGCTDYYYIYVNGTNHACLSHNGGFNVTTKLGIWAGGWNTNDGGSLFKFVDAEFENDNAHYYQLSDFADIVELKTADTPEGTTVGAYVNGAAYSAAYTATTTLVSAGNTSDAAACRDAYTALREACKTIRKIVPEEGKIYRIDITPGLTDARAGASMQIDDNAKLACGEYNASNARFYFAFEYDDNGNLYMKSLHTGTYLDEANAHNSNVQVGADAEAIENAKSIAINTLGTSNGAVVVSIVPTGGAMLNCTAKPGAVKAWDNAAVDKASAWVISEVEMDDAVANIKHTASLGANTSGADTNAYSTLFLAYNAIIPDGVTASIVESVNDNGQLVLTQVTGGVLPANTAVVLSCETTDAQNVPAEFVYTDEVSTFDTTGNMLRGTSYNKLVHCGNNYNIYMLGKKSGRVAFYWTYENRDENGNKVTVDGLGANHNLGGYVLCGANKAYLLESESNGQAAAAMYSFFMGGNTTDLDTPSAESTEDTVYDLQGRKLVKVISPGIYILNGKKVYVTEIEE